MHDRYIMCQSHHVMMDIDPPKIAISGIIQCCGEEVDTKSKEDQESGLLIVDWLYFGRDTVIDEHYCAWCGN
jgi:hypothetical protein